MFRPQIGLGTNKSLKAGGVTLQGMYDKYSPYGMWSAENRDITGTTTTLFDYAGLEDMANPAAADQPVLLANDANFGGRDAIFYDGLSGGTDHVVAVTSQYNNVNLGEIFFVSRAEVGRVLISFSSSDTSSSTKLVGNLGLASQDWLRVYNGTTLNRLSSSENATLNTGNVVIVSLVSDGSNYRLFLNGVEQTLVVSAGADDGNWFNDALGRDNISIGRLIDNSPNQSICEVALTAVFDTVMSDADRLALHNDAIEYYGQ